ncbi:MAG: hypothetical protein RL213_2048 [Bacteroidota bacterium]
MKKMIFAVSLFGGMFTTGLHAQPISQGTVTYQVVDPSDDGPASLKLTFSGTASRWDWKYAKHTDSILVVPDMKITGTVVHKGGKVFLNKSANSDLQYFTEPQIRENRQMEETEMIAGVKTRRNYYILMDPVHGDTREADFWLDESSTCSLPSVGGVPGKYGLPMDFTMRLGEQFIHLRATAVDRTPVAAAELSVPEPLPNDTDPALFKEPVKVADPPMDPPAKNK